MYVERSTISVTTASDGSATVYSPVGRGRIVGIFYVKDGTNPFGTTNTFTMTGETTAQAVLTVTNITASTHYRPYQQAQSIVGVGLTLGSGDAYPVGIVLAQERLKIVIAENGHTKLGSFIVVIDGAFSGS